MELSGTCERPEGSFTLQAVIMKRYLLFILLVLTFLSCRRDENKLFELVYEGAIEIPPGLNPVESHFSRTAEIFTNLNAELNARGLTLSDIRSIQPIEVRLRPDIGFVDYRSFTEMNAFIVSVTDPDDRLEVGFALDPRIFDNSVVNLIPGIADVKEYLDDGIIYLQLRFRVQEIPLSRTQHILRVRFQVSGK